MAAFAQLWDSCATLAENRHFSTLLGLKAGATLLRNYGKTVAAASSRRSRMTRLSAYGGVYANMGFSRDIGRKQAFFDFQPPESLRNYGRTLSEFQEPAGCSQVFHTHQNGNESINVASEKEVGQVDQVDQLPCFIGFLKV